MKFASDFSYMDVCFNGGSLDLNVNQKQALWCSTTVVNIVCYHLIVSESLFVEYSRVRHECVL